MLAKPEKSSHFILISLPFAKMQIIDVMLRVEILEPECIFNRRS